MRPSASWFCFTPTLLLLVLLSVDKTRADAVIAAPLLEQQLKIQPLPYPNLAAAKSAKLTLEEIQSRAETLEEKLGVYPPQFKSPEDRQGIYEVWSQVLAAAVTAEAIHGDSEPMVRVLTLLYREGHNLDVTGCADKALALLEKSLPKHPQSIPVNMEAAVFYLGLGMAARAEPIILHLRELAHSDKDLRIERLLLFAYLFQNKKAEAQQQVDHCLSLQPTDPFYVNTKKALVSNGLVSLRVPVGAPNETTLKGNPTLHFALDRQCEVLEIKPNEKKKGGELRAYILAPADGQSAANITLGSEIPGMSEEGIAQLHSGAKVTKLKSVFNDEPIDVWRYRDENHLYSSFEKRISDTQGEALILRIDVIANTQSRLESLEKALRFMDIIWPPKESK